MHGNIIARNLRSGGGKNAWAFQAYQVALVFLLRSTESLGSHEECCKVFLGKTIRHHLLRLRIHDTTRKPFLQYCISCFSQNTIQKMKNIQLFLDVFVLVLLVLFILTGPARICIGSLSTDVFEPRTSTGSRDFSSLMRISPFSFKKSSCKC